MKLLTKDIENKLQKQPLYSQEQKGDDARVIAKFFNPCGRGTWYVLEGEKQENGDVFAGVAFYLAFKSFVERIFHFTAPVTSQVPRRESSHH